MWPGSFRPGYRSDLFVNKPSVGRLHTDQAYRRRTFVDRLSRRECVAPEEPPSRNHSAAFTHALEITQEMHWAWVVDDDFLVVDCGDNEPRLSEQAAHIRNV